MRISRWIYIPLLSIAIYVLVQLLVDGWADTNDLLYFTISGAIVGFLTLYLNDAMVRLICGTNDKEIYKVRQKRNLTLLLKYEKAFECCLEAVVHLNPRKIQKEDLESGIIRFRTTNWCSYDDIITINLKKINATLTEVEIQTRPAPRGVCVASGYSWKNVEDICNHLKERDAEINKKVLVESARILDEVYVKPFQKEKV